MFGISNDVDNSKAAESSSFFLLRVTGQSHVVERPTHSMLGVQRVIVGIPQTK